jgi:hypothetical protein
MNGANPITAACVAPPKEALIYSSSRRPTEIPVGHKSGSIFLKGMDSGFRRNDGEELHQVLLPNANASGQQASWPAPQLANSVS